MTAHWHYGEGEGPSKAQEKGEGRIVIGYWLPKAKRAEEGRREAEAYLLSEDALVLGQTDRRHGKCHTKGNRIVRRRAVQCATRPPHSDSRLFQWGVTHRALFLCMSPGRIYMYTQSVL